MRGNQQEFRLCELNKLTKLDAEKPKNGPINCFNCDKKQTTALGK